MYNLSRKQQIKVFLFNILGTPLVSAIYILVFPFIYLTKQKDFTKKEKVKILGWCLYAFFLYPIYTIYYAFILHKKEFIAKLKSNFCEQMDVNEVKN